MKMVFNTAIFHFLLLTIAIACISGQDNPSSYDDTGLSPNYKPSVKLDPRLRKALLRVLTKLDQEEGGKQNEVSIRDINSQVTTTSNYDQPQYNQPQYNQGTQGPQYNQETQGPQYNQFKNQRLDSPNPTVNSYQSTSQGSSTYNPVSIHQDYSRLTQQPISSAAPSTAPSVATQDYDRLYQQFQNLQKTENAVNTNNPTQIPPNNNNNPNGSSNIVAFSPQDLDAFYKQQAANNPQPDGKNLIPEFVDFNMNFISNQDDLGGDKGGYKIIKFDKNDKESINSFLQNNNIEIISTLNGGNNAVPPPGMNEILLSSFNKDILLSSLQKGNGEIKNESNEVNGLPNPKENEIVQQKPKDILPTPNEPVSSEELFKSVILSKTQANNGGNAIFFNPSNIIAPSGKGDETELKPTDALPTIPTYTEGAESENFTASNKTSEVQFFSVPLVAAFTLEQNSYGIPQKVIPLNYLANGEYISEDRAKNIEESIILNKQQQKIAETANKTKEVDELKTKQQYLEQEKIYVDEKLKEFRQNESREKLVQQQTIGLQTANLEQYLQKFNREPKYNSDFASLQFGNQNLELKKQQLQEQFAREAELEKYKKHEYEKIQELNRLEKLKQFEKNLREFTQTESSLAQYKTEPSLAQYKTEPSLAQYKTEPSLAQYKTEPSFAQYNTESSIAQYKTAPRPQEIPQQPFKPSFPLVNFDNLPPVEFQKSLNIQYSQQYSGQPNLPLSQSSAPLPSGPQSFQGSQPLNQPSFTPALRSQQPVFPTNVPTFTPQNSFQNTQPNFIPNLPRSQPNFDTFNQQQQNFIPSQPILKQSQMNNVQFNPNPFQQIPRQNFHPNFQPNTNNFITGAQFPQQGFQQGRSLPLDNFRDFRPSPPLQFFSPQPFQNSFPQQFNQAFVQQPFLSNNRIVRREPSQSAGNFGVNNFVVPPVKSNPFKRNIVTPSRVLEPPFV